MPPLAWIVIAGVLVILTFAYSSWNSDWSAPLAPDAPVDAAR
jgi:hypothetical protein